MVGDDGWIKWAIGGISACLTAVWVHVNMRLNRADDHHDKKRDELWAALEKHRSENAAFHEMVLRELPTKADLIQLENRLTAAIAARRERWHKENSDG